MKYLIILLLLLPVVAADCCSEIRDGDISEECQPYLKEGMCRGATQTNNTSFLGWMIVYLIIAVGVFSIVNHIIHQHRMIEHQ